jgi:UDP-glucose:(heptosyl)LPS alpha-1,3-glucosyltransferase
LTEHYQVPTEKITVIPNAASLPAFSDAERAAWRASVRAGYQIGDDQTVFVFAAMNPQLKGAAQLLTAFTELVRCELPVTLMMAGKFARNLVELADRLGIRKQVRFIGPTNEMVKLYAAADVLVHPTFYDPSSKVVIEALMMGIPAISTRYNGASDMITAEDGTLRGRVIDEPSNIAALAKAMTELTDSDTRKACCAAATGLADSLSMTVHVDRLETLLADVIKQ